MSFVILVALWGCGGGGGEDRDQRIEGTQVGDCVDAADNDRDGLYDCDDPDCAASPDCATVTTVDPSIPDTGTPPIHTGDTATPLVEDVFEISDAGSSDILFVVDNSCSMAEEQDQLSQGFPVFMAYFLGSAVDYHIGVVSTDMVDPSHSGKLQEEGGYLFIDDQTLDATQVFSAMALMGTGGHYDEEGREAAYTALEIRKDAFNTGFLRDDSEMHIIVVSDEPDGSGNDVLSQTEFVDWLDSHKAARPNVTFSSIVGPPGGCGSGFGGIGAEEGVGYLEVTDAVGGLKLSICGDDWDLYMEDLGALASSGTAQSTYVLSVVPDVATIEVEVIDDGVTYVFIEGDDWTYDADTNAITFVDYRPSPGAEVTIGYEAA